MYTAVLQVTTYQLAKYEKDPMKNGREIAELRWWEINKYFIPTKFHQNSSSVSGEEVENLKA